jgi:hypothetical protein
MAERDATTRMLIDRDITKDADAVEAIAMATQLLVPTSIVLSMLRASQRLRPVGERSGVEQSDWYCYILSLIACGAEITGTFRKLAKKGWFQRMRDQLSDSDRAHLVKILDKDCGDIKRLFVVRDKIIFHFDPILVSTAIDLVTRRTPAPSLAAFDGDRADKQSTYFPLAIECMIGASGLEAKEFVSMIPLAVDLAGLAERLATASLRAGGLVVEPDDGEGGKA